MKEITTVLILAIPSFCFCQFEEDYCPCMEEPSTNPYLNMMNMVSMVNGDAELFTMDLPTRSYAHVEQVVSEQKITVNTTVPESLEEEEILTVSKAAITKKSSLKKKKKRVVFRIASKPKKRKYKGKCPKF